MKNTKSLLLALFAAGVTVSAQTTESEMMANINKCGSNYFAYSPEIKPYTAAPEGFVPFYISHYGRHGSRYHYSADDFKKMYGIMLRADSAKALTVLGKSVKERFGVKHVYINYIGAVVGTHTGPGVAVLFFYGKKR